MKKIIYTLLVTILAVSFYGCSKETSEIAETPTDIPVETPVEEVEEEMVETPVEEVKEQPVETPAGEPEDKEAEVDPYVVIPGPVSEADIELGHILVKDFITLSYDCGDAKTMPEDNISALTKIIQTPEHIDLFIDSTNYTLEQFGTINVVKVTPEFLYDDISTEGNKVLLYEAEVEFMADGEPLTQIFSLVLPKMDNTLRVFSMDVKE